jgi:hypothetical protein
MHRHLFRSSFLLLAASLIGCGPSPVARNPPPADPGTASLRYHDDPVVAFEPPMVCRNGVDAERSSSPTSLYCLLEAPDDVTHNVDFLLELGNRLGDPEGTVLSTQGDITLVRAGAGSRAVSAVGAEANSWDGTLTVTLAPGGALVIDGALSSVFSPSIAMTFNGIAAVVE